MKSSILKTLLTFCLVFVSMTTIAATAEGDAINAFTLPEMDGRAPRGLAYDPSTNSYWVTANFAYGNVKAYRFTYDGSTATVEETISIDPDDLSDPNDPYFYWSMDLATGDYLYANSDFKPDHTEGEGARFYHIDKTTGNIVNADNGYEGPFGPSNHLNGCAFDGSHLYLSSFENATIYEVETNGTVVSSFTHDSTANNGLAWGGLDTNDEGLWVVSGRPYNNYTVTKYIGGVKTEQWFINLNNEYIAGACWGLVANESILVSTFSGSKQIYEISFTPIGIKSASFGRIKASFK